MKMWPRSRTAILVIPALLWGCTERMPAETGYDPVTPGTPTAYRCTVDVAAESMSCAAPAGASNIILGGQGVYVTLASSNVAYDPGTGVFTADVTVTNLIPQPLATLDGETGTAEGVRVFFPAPPETTSGTGVVSVVPDGIGNFLGSGEPYFGYTGVELSASGFLPQGVTTAARTWTFDVPATVGTFSFGVYVDAAVPDPTGFVTITPTPGAMMEGATQLFSGVVNTPVGNPVDEPIAWSTSDEAIASITSGGLLTAEAPGTVNVLATAGTRTGSTTVAVCPSLAVGEAFTYPAGTSSFCLGGTAVGQEYAVVTTAGSAAAAGMTLTGSNTAGIIGGPDPAIIAKGAVIAQGRTSLRADDAFERALRQREQSLPAFRPAGAPAGLSMVITPGVPTVGDLMTINTEAVDACAISDERVGRVMHVGERIIIMADTLNPAGGFSAADYETIADEFDTIVWPRLNAVFGSEADLDSNARVIAFYTRAVNELTPPASSAYVGGFFYARDLFPVAACPTSNNGEIFYMLVPDPTGEINGNVRTTDFVRDVTVATLAHEYQHLINASRRLYVLPGFSGMFEEVWLNEGLSHIAEEEVFYAATGLTPGSNLDSGVLAAPTLDAFSEYMLQNFGRYREFLVTPMSESPIRQNDVLGTRGAAWSFLRYLADRTTGTALFTALLNTQQTGMTNLDTQLGASTLDMLRDWQIAVYADDVGTPDPEHTMPSWNFRSLYQNFDYGLGFGYPLLVYELASEVPEAFDVSMGSSHYAKLRVLPGEFATFTLQQGAAAPPAHVRVSIVRRQ